MTKAVLPALQFYPGDWRKDPGVQALDFHTRGVWFEILLLMHESEERGKLLLNGNPMPEAALSRILGLDNQSLTSALTTLLSYGVASIDEQTGALMSRRMVRDEKMRRARHESGKLGGNPVLLNQKSTPRVNQNPTPSDSSSDSVSKTEAAAAFDAGSSSNPDPEQVARTLVSLLTPNHPEPGSRDEANKEAAIALRMAENVVTEAEVFRMRHGEYISYWRMKRRRNHHAFIPNLARWFSDGDCLRSPPKAESPPGNGSGTLQDKLKREIAEAEEQDRLEEVGSATVGSRKTASSEIICSTSSGPRRNCG